MAKPAENTIIGTVLEITGLSKRSISPSRQPSPTKDTIALETIPEDKSTASSLSSDLHVKIETIKKSRKHKTKNETVAETFARKFSDENYIFDFGHDDKKTTIRYDQATLETLSEDTLALEDRKTLKPIRGFLEMKALMNTKYGYKEGRLSNTLDIIALYLLGQKILYLEAKSYCEFYLYRLMIPTIFISTICAVISGILTTQQYAIWGVAGANGFNTILLALINYFKLDARAEAHRMTAYSFDQLISECEFTSGKILITNQYLASETENTIINITNPKDLSGSTVKNDNIQIYDLAYVQHFITEIEKKVKEVKQKNQFIIPDAIRYRLPNIYYTNIFTVVKNMQLAEMILINKLKVMESTLTDIENRIIKGNREESDWEEYNFKYAQKNKLIEDILRFRQESLGFNEGLRNELNLTNKRQRCYKCLFY